jgi:hypothetical protein
LGADLQRTVNLMKALTDVERVGWCHHFDMVASRTEAVDEVVQCELNTPTNT